MIRKAATALVLLPLAILLVAFAVANRQIVAVSFDPFDQARPALLVELPLFALILILVVVGVLLGGVAAWLKQRKWRLAARRAEARARDLAVEIESLKRRGGMSEPPPAALPPPGRPRLTIPPPAA